jgi:hypothetical protein
MQTRAHFKKYELAVPHITALFKTEENFPMRGSVLERKRR